MSTSTQVTTFADLYTALLERTREDTSIPATVTKAKQMINTAHQDIYVGSGEKLSWCHRRATLTTHESYSTGTVAATKGSASLTGTSTVWTTDNDLGQDNARSGGKMTINGSYEVYGVTTVSGAGSITLDTAFIGTTDAEATYQYFEDEYALASDFLRPLDWTSFDDAGRIHIFGAQDFQRRFPRNRTPSRTFAACTLRNLPFSGDTTPVRKVHFAPPPDDFQIIPYTYVTSDIAVSASGAAQEDLSADTDEPIMPKRVRHLILLHALASWYRDYKDDQRALAVQAEYAALLKRVREDQEFGQQKARIRPMLGHYRSQARRPWRRGVGRFDLHGRFDRFEDT